MPAAHRRVIEPIDDHHAGRLGNGGSQRLGRPWSGMAASELSVGPKVGHYFWVFRLTINMSDNRFLLSFFSKTSFEN